MPESVVSLLSRLGARRKHHVKKMVSLVVS